MFFSRCASRRLNAFTLVEILVVVAIIVLLAAALFPVFNSVRGATRTTTCQNNLRQIGVAMQLYQTDYRFYPNIATAPDRCSWSFNIAPYVKADGVFTCPEAPEETYEPGCPISQNINGVLHTFTGGYSFNVAGSAHLSDVRILMPAKLIFVIDSDGSYTLAPPGNGPLSMEDLRVMRIERRHQSGANALFADGHVKWMSLDALTDRSHWTLSGRS